MIIQTRAQPARAIWLSAQCNFAALALIAIALLGCSAAPERSLSIKMYNAEKNSTLNCTARDLGHADRKMLADSVESCARQLEKSGFVRQSSTP